MHPRVTAALAVLLCIAPQAHAQTALGCPADNSRGVTVGNGWSVNGTKDAPFTAVTKTTFEQKLGDGNAIHIESHARQARDSAGRTMTEMVEGCDRGADGEMHPRLQIQVSDPAARTTTSWQVGVGDPSPKVVRIFYMPSPPPPPAPKQLTPEEQRAARARQAAMVKEAQARPDQPKFEQLGTKFINGVEATGTRTTQTIPAGDMGNDLPLVTVQETWRSRKLNLVVMAVNDDPRNGRTTMEYQELNFVEPDPAVFVPPPDYKVQEQYPPDVRPIVVP